MEPRRVVEISQKIVKFFLQSEDINVQTEFRNTIRDYFAELTPHIENDEFLCEGFTSLMIVHRLPGLPFPNNDSAFLEVLLESIECTPDDFIAWLEEIKKNKGLGLSFTLERKGSIKDYLN